MNAWTDPMNAWTDPEPLDSYVPTLPEVGAVVVLVIGAICAVTVRVLLRKWQP